MPSEAALWPFLAVLTRMGFAAAFLPLPGLRAAAAPVRAALALALTLLLRPAWPTPDPGGWPARAPALLAAEAALGLTLGVVLAWLAEVGVMAMQLAASQAGYSFASMIDPATQADSTALQLLGQLAGSLLFLASGADRELVRLLARSLEILPPGAFAPNPETAALVVRWSASAIVFAVRLALPVVVVLAIADLALALAARFQPQLQLLTLAFPAKALLALAVLAAMGDSFAHVFSRAIAAAFQAMGSALGAGG
jgi:flagellar biosynthetic protein FliR